MQDNPYKLIDSRTIYQNPWLKLREDKVVRQEGRQGIFGVVTVNPGVSVLPMDEDGQVYLIQEFQYAANKYTLLTVSGAVDAGEDPLMAAKRELKEESGLEAEEWISLGAVDSLTMIVDCTMHLFLAKGLTNGSADVSEQQTIKLIKLPFAEAVELVMSGRIAPAAANVLILKAARYLNMEA